MLTSLSSLLQTPCLGRSPGPANALLGGLISSLLLGYCQIGTETNWPDDYGPRYILKGIQVFDFIVIGAGVSGSIIAGRLSENPKYKVLLIEAGDNPPIESDIPGMVDNLNISYTWSYATKSNDKSCLSFPGKSCPLHCGKMLGGSSTINAPLFTRGNKADFDAWNNLGNPNWSWNSVVKHFRKSEDYQLPNPDHYYGTGGPLEVNRFEQNTQFNEILIEAAREGGYKHVDDFTDKNFVGYGTVNALVADGVKISSAKAYLQAGRPNLKVIKNAIATKIRFDSSKKATSVDFVYTDALNIRHKRNVWCSKEIILSAGAVESPKLLMLSGIGPRKLLRSLDIPVKSDLSVGENYQDHVTVPLVFQFLNNIPKNELSRDPTFEYFVNRKGPLAGVASFDFCGFLDVNNKTGGIYPNLQVHHLFRPKGSNPTDLLGSPTLTGLAAKTLRTSDVLTMLLVLLKPKSTGYVQLEDNNYRKQPIIYPNSLGEIDDVKFLVDAIKTLLKLQSTATFKKYGISHIGNDVAPCNRYAYGSDKFWYCYVRHFSRLAYHPVGTVKMGPDNDPDAVVDYKLNVRGIKGLRVADASIMPQIVSGDPMATGAMIGEKASALIKNKWKK